MSRSHDPLHHRRLGHASDLSGNSAEATLTRRQPRGGPPVVVWIFEVKMIWDDELMFSIF